MHRKAQGKGFFPRQSSEAAHRDVDSTPERRGEMQKYCLDNHCFVLSSKTEQGQD